MPDTGSAYGGKHTGETAVEARASPKPPANPSASSGPAKRNSPGPISAPLEKDERLRAVFEAAAKAFGWGRKKSSAGQGFGIAGGVEKGGRVATCAEVSVDPASGAVKVVRLVTAFECGAIVNPDHLKNQVEGAVMMGLGGALFEAIEFENGRILNSRFSRYRVPRFSDLPKLEVVLLDRKDLPSAGAGETPIVGVAPAIAGAIFDATGLRLRSLPLVPDGLKAVAEAAAGAARAG